MPSNLTDSTLEQVQFNGLSLNIQIWFVPMNKQAFFDSEQCLIVCIATKNFEVFVLRLSLTFGTVVTYG